MHEQTGDGLAGGDPGPGWRSAARRIALALLAVAVLSGLGLWLRWPATRVTVMRNEDVAGITYNADLLRRGKLPLVDSYEVKAPGSFFVVWGVWELIGRSIPALESAGVAWAILAALGVLAGGATLGGLGAGFLAALLYTLYAPITDSMTVNYNAWMVMPYIWAVAFLALGVKRGRLGWLVAAGASITVAALLKRQAATAVPVLGLVLAMGPWLWLPVGWRGVRPVRALLAFGAGVALGFVPIMGFYLAHGHLGTFVQSYFFSQSGWRYAAGAVDWGSRVDRLGDGFLGLWEYMALPSLLAAMSLAGSQVERRRGFSFAGLLLGAHFLMSFAGAALGFRFYMGYYLQILPAACWLAARPEGPLLRWFQPHAWPRGLLPRLSRVAAFGAVAVACVPAVLADAPDMRKVRRDRNVFNPYQYEAKRIGLLIRHHTKPGDRIWAWGRWAWPVYFHADRLSPIRFYKLLGVVTTNLTNTWKRPTSMTRYVKVGPWKELDRMVAAMRPAFIVTANNEAYAGFQGLEKLLAEHYVAYPGFQPDAYGFHVRKGFPIPGATAPPPPAIQAVDPSPAPPTEDKPAKGKPAKAKPAKGKPRAPEVTATPSGPVPATP